MSENRENKNEKKTIWIYAVILFTSAFIVLLLTAYSQIKFSKNISDYKNQLSSHQVQNKNFKLNLNSALEENKKLSDEIAKLKTEVKVANEQSNEKDKEIKKIKEENTNILEQYKVLLSAENEYNRGNIVGCADILYNNIKVEMLDNEAKTLYNYLVKKTYKDASKKLYLEGLSNFRKKQYATATKLFLKSNSFDSFEYYSDDCIYYAAYSEYKQGNKDAAAMHIQTLKEKYPKSSYSKDADHLLKKLK